MAHPRNLTYSPSPEFHHTQEEIAEAPGITQGVVPQTTARAWPVLNAELRTAEKTEPEQLQLAVSGY